MDTVLIVEDEPKIAELLAKYLSNASYHSHWLNQGIGVGAWVKEHQPSLILLDVMLPGKDGLEVCKEIRQFTQTPIIMLTALSEEIDRLLGLELGADDYICKPFSPREVIARVKAVLRRTTLNETDPSTETNTENNTEKLRLIRDRLTVHWKEHSVVLTLVEFELLETLVAKPGRIFSRQHLMEKAYPDNRIVSDRTIDSHIKKLRKRLESLNPNLNFIHSVYSVGYKYEPEP